MLGAQLRTEISKAHIDTPKVKAFCRKNPVGIVVDNKIRSRVWLTLLLAGEAPPPLPSVPPAARLQGEDARVVDADVRRTRGYLPIFQEPATQETVRMLLTTFCLANGVRYKQGMHELLAPFVALSPDPPLPPLPAEAIYAMFSRFISRYLGPFFRDEGTRVLQEGFSLFEMLLAYHDPELAQHLKKHDFPPALYLTPFLVTLFAHNLEMYLVHRLWDSYFSLDDPTLVYFLALALLRLRRPLLLPLDPGGREGGREAGVEVLEMIGEVKIRSQEDIGELVPLALEASWRTPRGMCMDRPR